MFILVFFSLVYGCRYAIVLFHPPKQVFALTEHGAERAIRVIGI